METSQKKEGDLNLKKLIEEAGLTQREISRRTGLKEVTINSWVSRKNIPRLDKAIILAMALGVDLKTLALSIGLDISKLSDKKYGKP